MNGRRNHEDIVQSRRNRSSQNVALDLDATILFPLLFPKKNRVLLINTSSPPTSHSHSATSRIGTNCVLPLSIVSYDGFQVISPSIIEILSHSSNSASRRLYNASIAPYIGASYVKFFESAVARVSSPSLIVEKAGSNVWAHKSWRVGKEFARTVTSANLLFASTELPLQPKVSQDLQSIDLDK
ncbi:hypothetical protein LXL04_000134 [Taraxacum kok-saghyz]